MTQNHRALAALSILALASTIQACTTADCADCGPCGFLGGPHPADGIEVTNMGADADGVAVVELARVKEGKCGDEGADYFWLRWDANAISVAEAPAGREIDSTMIESVGEEYAWKDRDLVASYEESGSGLTLTFETNMTFMFDTTLVVKCSLAGDAIDCQPS